jgi:hypothetical protein
VPRGVGNISAVEMITGLPCWYIRGSASDRLIRHGDPTERLAFQEASSAMGTQALSFPRRTRLVRGLNLCV